MYPSCDQSENHICDNYIPVHKRSITKSKPDHEVMYPKVLKGFFFLLNITIKL
ncbi:hypothetical protein HanIR_Chr11g0533931 [Helianthus annuus]|nr:hypothetical protein HanIR_Chr11g0533931 [Helianthus annuus]